MLRSLPPWLLILLAAPAWGASRFGGASHGGGWSSGGISAIGSANQRSARGGGVHGFAFHRGVRRDLFVIYGYGNCGFGFACGVNDPGYGYGYYGYGGDGGNAVSGSGGYSGGSNSGGYSGGGYSGGGYVPDPVGAEIPRVVFPTATSGPASSATMRKLFSLRLSTTLRLPSMPVTLIRHPKR